MIAAERLVYQKLSGANVGSGVPTYHLAGGAVTGRGTIRTGHTVVAGVDTVAYSSRGENA